MRSFGYKSIEEGISLSNAEYELNFWFIFNIDIHSS